MSLFLYLYKSKQTVGTISFYTHTQLLLFLTSRAPPLEMKGRVYARSSIIYGSETMTLLAGLAVGLKFEREVIQMIRWMSVFFP